MNQQVIELAYLGFEVRNIDAWDELLRSQIGLQRNRDRNHDGTIGYRADGNVQRVFIAEGDADDICAYGLAARTKRDFEAIVERLEVNDVPFKVLSDEATRSRHAERVIRFQDPFGMWVELAHGMEATPIPFYSEQAPEGFVTGSLGLGHILVLVPDMHRALNFYCHILGFSVSDTGRGPWEPAPSVDVTFLWSTPRHHSLALAHVPGAARHLGHFFLNLTSVDAVGRAHTRAKQGGVLIAHGLGRHTDGVFSFYGVTPSGFEYELGTDGYLVDESWTSRLLTSYTDWGHRPE